MPNGNVRAPRYFLAKPRKAAHAVVMTNGAPGALAGTLRYPRGTVES